MKKQIALPLCLALVLVAGCALAPEAFQTISTGVIQLGMTAWSQKQPELAKKVAEQVVQGANSALEYLNSNTGAASTVLNATVQAKLTQGLPPEVQSLIRTAAGALDKFLPAPAPDKYLTADQLAYLRAFVVSVRDGTVGVSQKAAIRELEKVQKLQKELKPGKWLNA